jgi:hypothetical protein
LFKEIPLILYVSSEQLVKGNQMFVTWDYKGANVKYLSCAFEGIYILDAINMPKDLFYEDMPKEFHVYGTHAYFNTIRP